MNKYFVSYEVCCPDNERMLGNIVVDFHEIKNINDVRRLEQFILQDVKKNYSALHVRLVTILNFIKLRGL